MARQVSNFMIGLFVTAGIIIGISVIIWVGASRYFEKGSMYVTYFDESVQGLQKDSMVKYRGVDIGRIVTINVAPDNKLIEVVMKIDLKDHLGENTIAQLRAVGLTGIVFIELDRRDSQVSEISPKIDFTTKYPIIPSRSSEIRQILTGIDKVIDKINKVDFPGISDQIKATAKSADNFLAGSRTNRIMSNLESSLAALDKSMTQLEKIASAGTLEGTLKEAGQTLAEVRPLILVLKNGVIDKISKIDFQGISEQIKATAKSADNFLADSRTDHILTNLESSTTALDKSMTRLEKIASEGTLEGTLKEARQTVAEVHSLISRLNNEVEAMKLTDTSDKANQVMDALARSTRASAVNILIATENMRSASESLERLIERIENNPSDLLFSRPSEQR